MANCLFCEVNPGVSQEHTWPDWFVTYWTQMARAKDEAFFFEYKLDDPEGKELHRFRGKFTVKGFCEKCNTGWMSDSEEVVKPIVTSLMTGKRTILTKQDQKFLSRWIVLKTLVFSLATPEMDLPKAIFRRFYRQKMKGITVHLLAIDTPFFGGRAILRGVSTARNNTGRLDSYQELFYLGYAALHVLGHPVRLDYVTSMERRQFTEVVQTVWPPSATTITWPPKGIMTSEILDRLVTDAPPEAEPSGNQSFYR